MYRNVRGVVGVYFERKIYLHAWEFNGILEINLESGQKTIHRGRKGASNNIGNLSSGAIVYQQKIYFMPRCAHTILKFDPRTLEYTEIIVESEQNYFNPVIVEDRLLLFPDLFSRNIPCMDLNSDIVTYRSLDVSKYENLLGKDRSVPVFSGAEQKGHLFFRACRFGPFVFKYDSLSGDGRFISIPQMDEGIVSLSFDGEFFWLLPNRGDRVIKWDSEQNRIVEIIDLKPYILGNHKASLVKCAGEKVYFAFDTNECIVKMNCEDESVVVYNPCDIDGFIGGNGRCSFSANVIMDEVMNLYFLPCHANGIIEIDTNGIMHYLDTSILTEEIVNEIGDSEMNEHMCSMNKFIDVVGQRGLSYRSSKTVGIAIWESMQRGIK